jgi:c-di-GMP-binding flagellar brake protein YcgR
MERATEVISRERALQILRDWIGSHQMGRLEISGKEFGWLTLLLGFEEARGRSCLLIDRIAGFEKFLARSPSLEVILQFRQKDGVTFWFRTRVIECRPHQLVAEMPGAIHRVQKRSFFRVRARSGTVVLFQRDGAKEERWSVIDYGLGGLAFRADPSLRLRVGDRLTRIELEVPQKDACIRFHISLAVVRRTERNPSERDLWGIEFLEITDQTKELLSRHLFQEQRTLLQRTRRG